MSKLTNLVYLQIAENIEIYIAQNRIKPNDKLPSERELAERWNVSRMTVRSAVEKLIDDGILYSVRGSGTYVAPKKLVLNLGNVHSFKDMITRQNFTLETKVLSSGRIEANKEIAKVFSVRLGTEIFKLTRKRIVNGAPFSIETFYLPYSAFIGIDEFDFSMQSLFELLNDHYQVKLSNQKYYIQSMPFSLEDTAALGLNEGDVGLYLNSHALDSNGKPVVLTKEMVRPDRCVITSISKEEA